MKFKPGRFLPLLITVLLTALTVFANPDVSNDGVWQKIDERSLQHLNSDRLIVPRAYQTFRLNKTALWAILNKAPLEFSTGSPTGIILTFPLPNGGFSRFRIEKSPIVEPALAAKFPELGETFRG